MSKGKILLSFDIEEFDLPREHGGEISLEKGVKISSGGLLKILDLLKRQKVKATFFTTGNFAKINPEMVLKIMQDGHEVACHGVDHFKPKRTDVVESKRIIEKVIGMEVVGYRQPRMFEISYSDLKKCRYKYDSSVNPAFIPGRYNHFDIPRKPFFEKEILEIPTSVTGLMRIPLFWLSLHLFPKKMYVKFATNVVEKTGYFATYFHPWEFADELREFKEAPFYIKKNSGDKLVEKLDFVISEFKKQGHEFETYKEFASTLEKS